MLTVSQKDVMFQWLEKERYGLFKKLVLITIYSVMCIYVCVRAYRMVGNKDICVCVCMSVCLCGTSLLHYVIITNKVLSNY